MGYKYTEQSVYQSVGALKEFLLRLVILRQAVTPSFGAVVMPPLASPASTWNGGALAQERVGSHP